MAVLMAVAVGCSNTSAEPTAADVTTATEVTTAKRIVTIYEEGPLRKIFTDGQMDAPLRGHLAIVGGCLVQQVDDGQATIVLWPLEVHWDEDAQQVVFSDDRRLGLGSDVVLGGGGISIDEIKEYWGDSQSVVDSLTACQPDVVSVWLAGEDFGLFHDFDLYTHCGIFGTMIDGVWWRANEPLGDGRRGGPPEGWADPSQSGTMTFYGDDFAVFMTAGGLVARFSPTTFTEPQVTCD